MSLRLSSRLPVTSSLRNVRRRVPPLSDENHSTSKLLDDATTYSDVHNLVTGPSPELPYPQKILEQMTEKSGRDILKEKNKQRFSRKKRTGEISFDHIPLEEQCVLLFPGQGAQFVGMGKSVVDHKPSLELFERASQTLGYDLLKLCSEGPSTKLDQTIYCQPAVFVSSLAAWQKLKDTDQDVNEKTTDVAGFSVGELSAVVAGGLMDFDDAMRIVKIRAEAMHECCQLIKSGMMTVRVNAASKLDAAMYDARKEGREAGELEVCEVANYLFCGVRVIGGTETALRYLEENQKKYGIQVLKRLAVSGAFHTRQMEQAVISVRNGLKDVELRDAVCNVYSNYTGHVYVPKKSEIRNNISKTVNNPVKWEQIQQLLFRKHKDDAFPRVIEVGPGRQLGAMWRNVSKKAFAFYENFPC